MQIPISNFLALYGTSMKPVFTSLANYDNYPVYMHCWGGADRTGTVAFMVEGLCGVSEEDLAIDLEQTAFSMFGNRYRYDNGSYLYGSTVKKMKEYSGDTLQEKFENCAENTIGLTKAQISNIQNIFCANGALFTGDYLENISFDGTKDCTVIFNMRDSATVSNVTIGGTSLNYSFANGTLTVASADLSNVSDGIMQITFDDGVVLETYFDTAI